MVARRAGSRVSATATDTIGMRNPANPMVGRKVTGRTTRARRLIPTVKPENTTARPAELIARATASWLS